MSRGPVFILNTVSVQWRYLHIEETLYGKKFVEVLAEKEGREIVFELFIADRTLTQREQRKFKRLIALVQKGHFKRVVLRGDSASLYACAVRKRAYPHTEVLNRAKENSQLDFFLQMFELDHEQSVRG